MSMTYNVEKGLLSCNDKTDPKPDLINPCDISTEDAGSVYQHSFWFDKNRFKTVMKRLISNKTDN